MDVVLFAFFPPAFGEGERRNFRLCVKLIGNIFFPPCPWQGGKKKKRRYLKGFHYKLSPRLPARR
jgi:hypothetical protein